MHGGALARAFGLAKAHAAKVAHEGVERVQVAPARLGGADAEVVFFAIAFAEVLFVKQAHGLQGGAVDVHAKAHAGGHVHGLAGVGAGKEGVQPRGVVAGGQLVVFAKLRVAANGGVVGKGRDGGHALVAIGGAVALIFINISTTYKSMWHALRDIFFTVSSVITTTGFSTAAKIGRASCRERV